MEQPAVTEGGGWASALEFSRLAFIPAPVRHGPALRVFS